MTQVLIEGQSGRQVSRRRRRQFLSCFLLLVLPFFIGWIRTSGLLGPREARNILSRVLNQPVECLEVEASAFRGFRIKQIKTLDSKLYSATIPSAEINLRTLPAFLGILIPSRVYLSNPRITVDPKREMPLRKFSSHLMSGMHPDELSISKGTVRFAPRNPYTYTINNLEITLQKQTKKKTFVQTQGTIAFGTSKTLRKLGQFQHQGVLYRKSKEYLAETLDCKLEQDGASLGAIQLDRSVRLSWNKKAPFTAMLPTEITCEMRPFDSLLVRPLLPVALADMITTGTLACDVSASISAGGRLLDFAATIKGTDVARPGSENVGFWSKIDLQTDLAVRELHSYSLDLRLLSGNSSRGKARIRAASETESKNHEGTISIENLDLGTALGLLKMPIEGIEQARFSFEQAWNKDAKAGKVTAAGEAEISNLVVRKGEKRYAPLRLEARTNLLWQKGRLRGAWPQSQIVLLRSFSGQTPLDTLTIGADLGLSDPGSLNRIALSSPRISAESYAEAAKKLWPWLRQLRNKTPASWDLPPAAFDASIEELALGEQPLERIHARGAISRNEAELTSSTVQLAHGTIEFRGKCNLADAGWPFSLRTTGLGVDLSDAVLRLGIEMPVAPKAIATWKGTVEGKAGKVDAAAIDLALDGPDLHSIPQLAGLKALPGMGDIVDRINTRVSYSNDETQYQNMQITGANGGLFIKGNGAVKSSGAYEYLMDLAVSETFLNQLQPAPERDSLIRTGNGLLHYPLQVRITGAEGVEGKLGFAPYE